MQDLTASNEIESGEGTGDLAPGSLGRADRQGVTRDPAARFIANAAGTQSCQSQTVKRNAMAKFLANGFGLQLYGP